MVGTEDKRGFQMVEVPSYPQPPSVLTFSYQLNLLPFFGFLRRVKPRDFPVVHPSCTVEVSPSRPPPPVDFCKVRPSRVRILPTPSIGGNRGSLPLIFYGTHRRSFPGLHVECSDDRTWNVFFLPGAIPCLSLRFLGHFPSPGKPNPLPFFSGNGLGCRDRPRGTLFVLINLFPLTQSATPSFIPLCFLTLAQNPRGCALSSPFPRHWRSTSLGACSRRRFGR